MNADRKVIPLPVAPPAPNADGLEVNEYLMPGVVRGNKDIEASSSSIEYPMPTPEQMAAGDECETRR